jgi:hypothetical protein
MNTIEVTFEEILDTIYSQSELYENLDKDDESFEISIEFYEKGLTIEGIKRILSNFFFNIEFWKYWLIHKDLNNSSIDIPISDLEKLKKVTNIVTYWGINIDFLRDQIYEFLLDFTEISHQWTRSESNSDSDSESDCDSVFNSESNSDSNYIENLRELQKILSEAWPETLFKHEACQILGMNLKLEEKSLCIRAGTVSVPFLEYIFVLKNQYPYNHKNRFNLEIRTMIKALEEGYTDCFKYIIDKKFITMEWFKYHISLYEQLCRILLRDNRKDCFEHFINNVFCPETKKTFIRRFMDLIQKISYKDINEDFLTYIGELRFIEYVNKDHIFVTYINRLNILQLTLDEDKTSS